MKRILIFLAICLLSIGLFCPFAALADGNSVLLSDEAGVLTADEFETLSAKLEETSAKYNTDIAALVVNGIDGGMNISEYADNYFLEKNYGRNDFKDGILFVVDVSGRDWYFTTHGDTIYSFTDAGISRMGDEVRNYLSNGDYAGAINEYADLAGGMIDYRNREGHAFLQDEEEQGERNDAGSLGIKGVIGVIAGLLGSFGITKGMKNQLTSVRSKADASGYFNPAELKLRAQKDTFLYVNVSKIPIRDNSNNGGGGFSTHTTGGSSFGGGGGKF